MNLEKEVKTKIFTTSKKILVVFFACFLVALFLFVFVVNVDDFAWTSDLVSFITGGRIVRFGEGREIYNLDIQQKHQTIIAAPNKLIMLPFRNLPAYSIFFVPLSYFSISLAYKIYTLIIIITTLFISWFSRKALDGVKNTYWVFLPLIFFPSLGAIFTGQNSTFIVLAFMLVFYFLKKKKSFMTGVVLGLLLLKFQYIVALPFVYFLTSDKKELIKGFIVSSFFTLLLSVIISGTGFFIEYLKMLVATENPIYGTKPVSMFTLFSSLSQLTSFSKQYIFLFNLILYMVSIWVFYKNYKRLSLRKNFVVLTLLTLVFCVHAGNVDMALLLVPLWLLIDIYKSGENFSVEYILVIFIIIFSSLFHGFGLSFVIPFLFLLSVALLVIKPKLQLS